ncbi:MAG: cupredoxin domain-containing protein [Chloroflexota bacterium]|nr:cupredoxin domain-containing protein [Chloroflexota bacterium]
MFDLRDVLRRSTFLILIGLVSVSLVACGSGGSSAGTTVGTVTVSGGKVAVSADKLKFDATTIKAKAGEAFTITFTNKEGQPHNVAVYRSKGGDKIVRGNIISGPDKSDEISVPALEAGTYYFRCDVHSDMNGSVVVS